MPSGLEIGRNQMAGKPGCREARGRFTVVELAIALAGRVSRPVRRPEPLDAATLLIDKDWSFPPNDVTKRLNKFLYLSWCTHVPLEDDGAPRLGIAEKGALIGGNAQAPPIR